MPQFLQQLQNPEMQQMMTNPQALNAILQIQQGMEQLRQVAPDLVGSLGVPPMPPVTTTAPTSGGDSTTTTTAPNPAAAAAGGIQNSAMFSDFMSRMVSSMTQNQNNQPPEERYQSQLEQLAAMGFVNREANLQGKNLFFLKMKIFNKIYNFLALIATFGDINAAVERLLALGQLSLS